MHLAHIPVSVLAAFGLIAGIMCQHMFIHSLDHIPYLIGVCICAPCCWYIYQTNSQTLIRYSTLIFVCFLCGNWRYSMQQSHIDSLWKSLEYTTRDLRGTIQDISTTNIPSQLRYRIQITQEKIKTTTTWNSAHFTLHIYSKQNLSLQVADTIEIPCVKFSKRSNSEYDQYLAKEGVISSLFVSLASCAVIHRPAISFNRWLYTVRNQLFTTITKKMSDSTASLFSSLFLGNTKVNQQESSEWNQLFRAWGLSHYLARSGLHLALFVYIWLMLFRYVPCSFMLKQLLISFLTLMYAVLSWSSTSFYRSINTFALYMWCMLHKRRTHFLHMLASICLATLIYNPSTLLFLDFELSYGLTFALGWFNSLDKNRTNS